MIILGLTGSIGMGKSTAALMLRRMGVPVYEADKEVRQLLSPGGKAVAPVLKLFPDVGSTQGHVDRLKLGEKVFKNPALLKKLEQILHPLVREREKTFLQQHRQKKVPVVVLDIPLLFETHGEDRVDAIIVMTASAHVQRQRVLTRPDMTEEKFRAILARQMPDADKRHRADFIVRSDQGRAHTWHALRRILALGIESRRKSLYY